MDIQRQAKIIEKHCGLNYQAALDVAAKCNKQKDWKTYKKDCDHEGFILKPEMETTLKKVKGANTYRVSAKGNYEVRIDFDVQADSDIKAEAFVQDCMDADCLFGTPYDENPDVILDHKIQLISENSLPFVTTVISNADGYSHKYLTATEIDAMHKGYRRETKRDREVADALAFIQDEVWGSDQEFNPTEKLLPKTRELVMNITKSIGMDIPWENTSGPAASNPNYCYRWAFEDDNNKVALFLIWHDHIEEKDGTLIYRYTNEDYSDSPVWQTRAKKVNQALSKALQGNYEVRAAICSRPLQKDKASVVECRELDPVRWDIQKEGSDYILVRK